MKNWHTTISLFLLLSTASQVFAQQNPTAPGWHEEQTLDVHGVTRYYRYFVPLQIADPAAVVLLLHGGGSNMRTVTNPPNGSGHQWPSIAEENGLLLMVPNGTNIDDGNASGNDQNWNDCRIGEVGSSADDVGFIDALLGWAETTFSIDAQRVYSTGVSNGGMMTYRLLEELPQRIAAGAAFIANHPEPSECTPQQLPRSVMMINGTADPLVPDEGGPVNNGRRGSVMSTADSIAYWVNTNQTWQVASERLQLPDLNPDDQSTVNSTLYRGGDSGSEVLYYQMLGAGHSTPSIVFGQNPALISLLGPQNRDIEGNREAWGFLSRQRRDGRTGQVLTPSALSGAWFDPATDGEGLLLVTTPFGFGGYYFGNDVRQQRLWILSSLHTDELVWGDTVALTLSQSAQGSFDQPAPPALSEPWGELTLTVNDCRSITANLDGLDGNKQLNLIPLVMLRGQICIPPEN